VVVFDGSVAEQLGEVAGDVPTLGLAVTLGDDVAVPSGLTSHRWHELATSSEVVPGSTHSPSDPAMVLFTSGTTGASKGCLLSHRYTLRQAGLMAEHLRFVESDVLYCPFPLFHIDATVLTVGPALVLGATAAIGERFSVSGFWPEVRRFGATVFDFMGATLTMLHKQPPGPEDGVNPVRLAWGVPVPEFADEFESRFGLQLVELYGSTDAGVPIYHPVDEPRRPRSCGKVIDAYDVRIVDEYGCEVPAGEVGELVVRPLEPSLISDGYLGMPEATLASRRNLWFHTGDLARRDGDGHHYFVGRRSDAIRRRGENISSMELEAEILEHGPVVEAAVVGVPSEVGEEDVKAFVVVRDGFTPEGLIGFLEPRIPAFMLPRYVAVVEALPKTPTEKVRKHELKERPPAGPVWERRPDPRPA
jgi:crotonobetaine/carnitine-CoA ligase